jgi:dihydroorotase
MRLIIRGGRVIDPSSGLDRVADIFIADGRIRGIGDAPAGFSADQSIDAHGLAVCPGLVDLAARPREPGLTHKADIASEARAAVAGGITTLCCPPDTQPTVDTASVVEHLRRRAEHAGVRLTPLGALTKGLEGQLLSNMASLKDAGCAAVSDGGRPVANARVLRRAMEYAQTFDLPVLLTPNDPSLSEGGLMHEGGVATRMGLAGIPQAAETAALGRDLALVEQTGARTHFGRLSSRRGAELIARAQREGLPVTGDVAIHQLFFTEQDLWGFESAFRVEPPFRSMIDREGLRRAVAEGTLALCSDHQPHEPDAKHAPIASAAPGISGLDSLLALVLRLVDEGVLPLREALARITCDPARILGLDVGVLAQDRPADLCIFDPDAVWRLQPETMHSRGKNSPFIGWEFTGRVAYSLVNGALVYRRPG